MSETFILGFEIVSVLFALFDFFYAYKSYRQAEEMGRFLGASAFSAGVIVICYLFSIRPGTYLSASVAASLYFSGIDWMLVSLTHFIFLYTGRNKTKLSIYARRMIRVIAAADSVILMTNIVSEIAVHYVESGSRVAPYTYEMKPLYIAHLLFNYALIIFIMYNLFAKVIATPKIYQNQYFLIIFAICLVVLLNAYFLYPSGNDIWGSIDISVLAYSLGLLITYWAAFEYRFRYMPRVLSMTVFENIDQGLALFDNDEELIMHNERSSELLGKKLPAKMPSSELVSLLQLHDVDDAKDQYSIQCEMSSGKILRCDYTRLRDDKDGVIGNLYVLTDTSNETDLLTGFQMWMRFRQTALERPELFSSPATAVIFDITGLGEVNRTYGRDAGDQRIRRLARLIRELMPPESYLIRGYEANLVAVVPGSGEADLLERTRQIVEASGTAVHFGISELSERADLPAENAEHEMRKYREESIGENHTIIETIQTAAWDLQVKKMLDHHSDHSQVLTSLIKALQETDSETEAHVQRTQKMGKLLGKRVGLTDAQLSELKLLCLLHDIGKIGIPLEILNKPGKLSEDEWAVLRTHPAKGYQICMSTQELSPIARMVLCHHERWDGKGYPEQIAGEHIPVLSRIISIVDAYDAMVNDRPYRKGLSVEAAQEEIRRCAGTQFDPALAEEFLTLLREHPELAEGERTGAPEIGILFQSFTQEEEDGNTFPVLYSRYVLDVEERIEEVDETFTLLTGYSREQAAGMLQFDLIPPEERANYIVTVSNMLSRGNLVFLQHEILKKDGSRISVLCMGKKYYDSALKAYRSEILITPARNE